MKRHRNKKGQFTIDPFFRVCLKWSMTLIVMYTALTLAGVNVKQKFEAIVSIGRELTPIHNVSAVSEIREIQNNKTWIDSKIEKVAAKYGRSAYQMKRTVECETKYRNIQSEVKVPSGPNGRENSWGIYQIYLTKHPTVSRAEALDIDFAIEWAAINWNKVVWYAYNRKTDKCN